MVRTRSGWDAVFPDPHDLARFCLEHLLGHEVGHHVAWYVQGLRQNTRQAEAPTTTLAAGGRCCPPC